MAVNKVTYNNNTLIDLTADSVTPDTLLSGTTAHAKDGSSISGTVVVVHYYVGSTAPSSSLGADGDIYIKVKG